MNPIQISPPRECDLWTEVLSKDLVLNAFDVVKNYKSDDHLIRDVKACKRCGQLYFGELYNDLNPWTWDTDKCYVFIPVDNIDIADSLQQLPRELIAQFMAIHLTLKPDDGEPFWTNVKVLRAGKNNWDSLMDFVNALDEETQYAFALAITNKALPLWEDYANKNPLEYTDTVVGMRHIIAKDIVNRTLDAVRKELFTRKSQLDVLSKLREEFMEPLVALQDSDWELPYSVLRTFYAASNLVHRLTGDAESPFDEPLIYVVINQAFDALLHEGILTIDKANAYMRNFPISSSSSNTIIDNSGGSDPGD